MKLKALRTMAMVAVAASAVLTGCAQTQPQPPAAPDAQPGTPMPGPMWKKGERPMRQPMTAEQRKALREQRFAREATYLQITPAQRPQWDAYVNAHTAMFNTMPGDPAAMREAVSKMTPEQHAQFRTARMNAMADHMKNVAAAETQLRAVLTPEQRVRLEQMHMRGGYRGMHMGGGMRGKPGWGGNAAPAMQQP